MICWNMDSKTHPTWIEVTIGPWDTHDRSLAVHLLEAVNEIGLRGYRIISHAEYYDWEKMNNHYRFTVEKWEDKWNHSLS